MIYFKLCTNLFSYFRGAHLSDEGFLREGNLGLDEGIHEETHLKEFLAFPPPVPLIVLLPLLVSRSA